MAIETVSSKTRTHIRSFSRRQGRITPSQRAALETLWGRYGLDPTTLFVPHEVFGNYGPIILDIGFGNGDTLTDTAESYPDKNYVGIDVHRPGVGRLLAQLDQRHIQNVRVYCADVVDILKFNIADASLDGINLFFPDPWPKKRHHKRRLVNPGFAALIGKKLRKGGNFFAATDWEDYATQMQQALSSCTFLENCAGANKFSQRPVERGITKFERRGIKLGHQIWDLNYEKI